jgi:hypothetical protein
LTVHTAEKLSSVIETQTEGIGDTVMPRRVFVTKEEYEAILQWESEGGALVEIEYVIVD